MLVTVTIMAFNQANGVTAAPKHHRDVCIKGVKGLNTITCCNMALLGPFGGKIAGLAKIKKLIEIVISSLKSRMMTPATHNVQENVIKNKQLNRSESGKRRILGEYEP